MSAIQEIPSNVAGNSDFYDYNLSRNEEPLLSPETLERLRALPTDGEVFHRYIGLDPIIQPVSNDFGGQRVDPNFGSYRDVRFTPLQPPDFLTNPRSSQTWTASAAVGYNPIPDHVYLRLNVQDIIEKLLDLENPNETVLVFSAAHSHSQEISRHLRRIEYWHAQRDSMEFVSENGMLVFLNSDIDRVRSLMITSLIVVGSFSDYILHTLYSRLRGRRNG